MEKNSPVIFTIGHSTKTLDELIHILQAHSVKMVADIRTVPRSRHNPQFNRETLPESLNSYSIDYKHIPGLGGLRKPRKDSTNMGWHNDSFRGFADYMQTDEFEKSLEELMNLAASIRTAMMCAEALPWRCHRSLIADALLVRGIQVEHIMSLNRTAPHSLTSFANVHGTVITYPAFTFADYKESK